MDIRNAMQVGKGRKLLHYHTTPPNFDVASPDDVTVCEVWYRVAMAAQTKI